MDMLLLDVLGGSLETQTQMTIIKAHSSSCWPLFIHGSFGYVKLAAWTARGTSSLECMHGYMRHFPYIMPMLNIDCA